jgi:hypothetical protein
MSSNLNCSYTARSSLAYVRGGFLEIFLSADRFGLIWFSGFRGEDLNVIFYQNMPNLHNRYISAERKISEKNAEYRLNKFKKNLLLRNY